MQLKKLQIKLIVKSPSFVVVICASCRNYQQTVFSDDLSFTNGTYLRYYRLVPEGWQSG